MKRLEPLDVPDEANLRALAENAKLSSYPALRSALRRIIASYNGYRSAKGNAAHPQCPQELRLAATLADALRRHYGSPPASIEQFLSHLRTRGSPDVCPMCGSPKTGQLDHVFPKETFSEFSVFSLNLVPACDCNTKKGVCLRGTKNGQRILHPYFDNVLKQRLVRAVITPSPQGNYATPQIGLLPLVANKGNRFRAVHFHLNNILAKTDVLARFDTSWSKFWRHPEDYFGEPKNLLKFRRSIHVYLEKQDRHFGTPNNWDSMLIAGIAADPLVEEALWKRLIEVQTDPALIPANEPAARRNSQNAVP